MRSDLHLLEYRLFYLLARWAGPLPSEVEL
jgi:hypothetical protein